MERMLIAFLKGMGITPELVQSKMDEFIKTVKNYDARLARIEKALGIQDEPVSEDGNILRLPVDKKTG